MGPTWGVSPAPRAFEAAGVDWLPWGTRSGGAAPESRIMFLTDTRSVPSVASSLTIGAALVLSTLPSLLPRAPLIQGLLSGGLVLLVLALMAMVRGLVRLRGSQRQSPTDHRTQTQRLVLAGSFVTVLGTVWWGQQSLVETTAALGMPAPGAAYWWVAGGLALAVIGLGLALFSAMRRVLRALRSRRSPSSRWRTRGPMLAAVLVGAAVTTAAAAPPGALDFLRKELGPDHVMLVESPVGASRSFALASETSAPEAGADLAVDRLVTAGGLERGAILVVLPTGSGWVNREAVTALEAELGGDVAVVSAQYADLPSWWAYLVDQEPATRSAQGLLTGVLDQVDALPVSQRPKVYVYGESLGALAGQAAVAQVNDAAICGVLWAGAPGSASSGHPRERSLGNADDPITYLTAQTAAQRPDGWPGLWLPGLSYATTVLDMGASLEPEPGHGHMYGGEQDWSLPSC